MRPELYRPRALRVARRADLKQNREHSPVQCHELNAAWLDEPMVRVVLPRGALEGKLVELHVLRGAGPGRRGPYAAWPAVPAPPQGSPADPLIGEPFGLAAMWYFEILILLCVSKPPAPCDRLP
jgi:hypothetical protein